MKCGFCLKALPEPKGYDVECRFCHATYSPTGVEHTGRLRYELHAPPPAEYENRCMAAKQLMDAADKVVTKPGEALVIIEDAWVALWAETHGEKNQLIDELDRLRTANEELAAECWELRELLASASRTVAGVLDSFKYTDADPTILHIFGALTELHDDIKEYEDGSRTVLDEERRKDS